MVTLLGVFFSILGEDCRLGLTFCGGGDGLGVGHGQRDRPHGAVVRRGRQDWGEVARDLPDHLTAAVGLQVTGS